MTDFNKHVLVQCLSEFFSIVLRQAIAIIIVFSVWQAFTSTAGALTWHIICCTLAVFPLIVEGLLLFNLDEGVIEIDKRVKVILHTVLTVISTSLLLIGIGLEIDRIEKKTKLGHFSQSHGIVGLICLIFIFISVALGIFARFAKALRGYVKISVNHLVHNIVGIITYFLAIASIATGFYTSSFHSSEDAKLAATILSVIVGIWSLKHCYVSMYKQITLCT